MHKIRFRPGLPGPRCRSLQRSPKPSSWFKRSPTSKGKGEEEKGRKEIGGGRGKKRGVEGKERGRGGEGDGREEGKMEGKRRR